MKHQHHVHAISPAAWPRCSEVEIDDERIGFKLAKRQAYDLVKAYEKGPHIEFMNCNTDGLFGLFVRRWGPLLLSDFELKYGWGVQRLEDYKAYRACLRAIKRMLDACKDRENQREALINFFRASEAGPGLGGTFALDTIKEIYTFHQDPYRWADSATISEVRMTLARCVEDWYRSPSTWGFRVYERGKTLEVRPSFELNSLWEGLRWMLFFDEWNSRPPTLCHECSNLFRPTSAHKRKYCSPECGHRATNRKWRQKDLLKAKAIRKSKEADNVTRKTR